MWKPYKVEDLLINDHTSSSYRKGILITTPSFIFLSTNINNIQQILWILLFSGRLSIYRFYRSKQFWTPKLVDQKKLNVKLYLWTHVQFLVQHVLSRLYRNIVHTCWWKTQKILWEKNILWIFEVPPKLEVWRLKPVWTWNTSTEVVSRRLSQPW